MHTRKLFPSKHGFPSSCLFVFQEIPGKRLTSDANRTQRWRYRSLKVWFPSERSPSSSTPAIRQASLIALSIRPCFASKIAE